MSAPNNHPHFDDGGAHNWFVTLQGGIEEAKRSGRMIFVEFGRKACRDCKALVEDLMTEAGTADKLRTHFVMVAADADSDDDPAVLELMLQVPNGGALPFAMFADPEGLFLHGDSGLVSADEFNSTLERLIANRQ